MDNSSKALAAFILGVATGALLGLTMAPSSGRKTRKQLNESANDVLYDLEDAWEEGAERIKELANSAVEELERYSKKLTKDM